MEEKIIDSKNESNLLIAKSIHKKNGLSGSSEQAYSFIISSLSLINNKDFKEAELLDIITDGEDDHNIDAIHFNGESLDIYSVSNKIANYPELNALKDSVKSALMDDLQKKDKTYFNSLNLKIREALTKFYGLKKEKKIRIFAIYKSISNIQIADNIKKELSPDVDFSFLTKKNLINKILESEIFLDEFKFDVSSTDMLSKNKEVLIFKAKILDLLRLQEESIKNNSDLFNKNVRIFLKNKGLTNEFKSTIENEPENFYLLNNGITIVTTNDIGVSQAGKITIKEPQVVNGAQTINSLYSEFGYDEKNKGLAKASVIVKIIKADEDFTKKVCETSNTQLPIKLWDLRANDDIHKKIELFFDTENYHYLRKTRQVSKRDKVGIQLTKFIQWFYSVEYKNPSDAKNKKKMLFEISSPLGLYKKIESSLENILDTDSDKLLKISDTALFVYDEIKKEKDKTKQGLLKDADLHIIMILFYKGKDKFDDVIKYIEDFVRKEQVKDPNITNNKIFTKSNILSKELLKNIK